MWLYDRFDAEGQTLVNPANWQERVPYVIVGTPGHNRSLVHEVRVNAHEWDAWVDGRAVPLGAPIENVDGRLFVPLRFVANVLGVDDANIIWDPILRQVTIITPERNVVFVENSEHYWINGIAQSTYENGVWAFPFVHPQHDRFYVPFRFVGYALGIEVSNEGATGIYNPR